MKKNYTLFSLFGALILSAGSASAAGVYDNNISALNINMLTDTFASYPNYGTKMSDLFKKAPVMYGTMDRLDEYGDDGSTVMSFYEPKQDLLFNNIWLDASHINGHFHYGQDINQHARFNLLTIGANTKQIDLRRGNISFGGFASYINTKVPDVRGNGDAFGVFARYKYKSFATTLLADMGSVNNDTNGTRFNNSWANIAVGASGTAKIDETFFIRPEAYMAYSFVSSSDLYANGNNVSMNDFNFFNVAPGISFIKQIVPNWYGTLSGKYVAHFGGKNDIHTGATSTTGLYLDNHTDIGIDVEYDYKQFVFTGKIHKQLGGIDGISATLDAKYAF